METGVAGEPRPLGEPGRCCRGTGGLGRALSRLMAARGAQVTIVGRTFREGDTPGIHFRRADLDLMSEALKPSRRLDRLSYSYLEKTCGTFLRR
jgi:hypothetical protein